MRFSQTTVEAFRRELSKLAEVQYRVVAGADGKVLLDTKIPYVAELPTDPAKAVAALREKIEKAPPSQWTHKQVAVPVNVLGPLHKTKLFRRHWDAIPLPGEGPFRTTWRGRGPLAGGLHAHRLKGLYLVHNDAHDPTQVRKTLRHALSEAPKSWWLRYTKKLDAHVKDLEERASRQRKARRVRRKRG